MSTRKPKTEILDLKALRARLKESGETEQWRSLEEAAGTDEYRQFLNAEFPQQIQKPGRVDRRNFMRLMGASLTLAGLGACTRQPVERIVPYVSQPELIVPGKPLFFASGILQSGVAQPVLVESHMGRPTKIEGNPEHPESRGATDAVTQAALLNLYDPDRSQTILRSGLISNWDSFLAAVQAMLERQRLAGGAGIRILTETVTSPTLAGQLRRFLEDFPEAHWHQYEPSNRDSVREGSRLAFGEFVEPHYRIDRADVIFSLESDFLFAGPSHLRHAREFAAARRVRLGRDRMNRLYAVESTPTVTGTKADHRLALRPHEIQAVALEAARRLGLDVGGADTSAAVPYVTFVSALVGDLEKNRGRSLVVAGDQQPVALHALAHALNEGLGNVGHTVYFTDPLEAQPELQIESLGRLVSDIGAGQVQLLLILGGNPVYDAPADLDFPEALAQVPLRAHLSPSLDETSLLCHWHVPETHSLESWGDARAGDGSVTVLQPLIAPLFSGRSALELLAALSGRPGASSHDLVKGYWEEELAREDFEAFWQTALHDGWIPEATLPERTVSVLEGLAGRLDGLDPTAPSQGETLDLIFRPDPAVFDGRYANNGWLQELPKPITKLTWDNPVQVSLGTAERLGLRNGQWAEIELEGRSVTAPVWIVPGQADSTLVLHLGYGRTAAGRVGNELGFNFYTLRTSQRPWQTGGATMQPGRGRYALAATQHHFAMEGRRLVRSATLEEYRRNPEFVHVGSHDPGPEMSLFPDAHTYKGYSWGMVIDLNACVGCNACVLACQAENNIPVVGKDQVANGRQMHWIRVDGYFQGDPDNPDYLHQPVPCMHCENAPCEIVCPVAATVHDSEGLNVMVYNRCVGTRYCSNNCPYKVRRFNFYLYQDWETPTFKLLRNPDVTVRSRGVMEKCTYCQQRINAARIEAEKEDRRIQDGEVLTACQQVCPSQAIVFGDINDSQSRVALLKQESLNYGILADLGVRPRTTYLGRLRNPNPEMQNE